MVSGRFQKDSGANGARVFTAIKGWDKKFDNLLPVTSSLHDCQGLSLSIDEARECADFRGTVHWAMVEAGKDHREFDDDTWTTMSENCLQLVHAINAFPDVDNVETANHLATHATSTFLLDLLNRGWCLRKEVIKVEGEMISGAMPEPDICRTMLMDLACVANAYAGVVKSDHADKVVKFLPSPDNVLQLFKPYADKVQDLKSVRGRSYIDHLHMELDRTNTRLARVAGGGQKAEENYRIEFTMTETIGDPDFIEKLKSMKAKVYLKDIQVRQGEARKACLLEVISANRLC